jgi:hypothetical protein
LLEGLFLCSIEGLAICSKSDAVLEEFAKEHDVEVIVINE